MAAEATSPASAPLTARPNQARPLYGGRYRLQFSPYGCPQCRLQTPHAFLLLHFLLAEEETGREVCDVVCARCEPERFARLERLASQLA